MIRTSPLLGVAVVGAVLVLGCDGGAGDDPGPDGGGGQSGRPEGWGEDSHGWGAEPDYERLFGEGVVHRFDIAITPEDHQRMMDDLAAKLSGGVGDVETPVYVPATVEHDGLTWWHVGVRYKGNSSLRAAYQMGVRKLAVRLNFDYFELEHPEINEQRFWGFEELSFANAYGDRSLIRDRLAGEIFRACGVPAARGAFARVYLDFGEGPVYLGLYTMIEDPADQMMTAQLGNRQGNLYKPEGDRARLDGFQRDSFERKLKTDNDALENWEDVRALIEALHADRSDAAAWRDGLEALFDVDGFLRFLAASQTMENFDTYPFRAHNYYLYGDQDNGERLTWVPWDLNLSLMHRAVDGLDAGEVMLDAVDESWPLVRFLLDDPLYRSRYREELGAVLEGCFAQETVEQLAQGYHDLIAPHVVGDEPEAKPYTFLGDADDFLTSLSEGDDALFPHFADRRAAVSAAL